MPKLRIVLVVATLLALVAGGSTKADSMPDKTPKQAAKKFNFKQTKKQTVQYLLFLPQGYSPKSEKRWPTILFLHGAGERGSDVWKVAVHGPPKIVGSRPDFPFIVISPQCPDGQIWSKDVVLGLLDEVTGKYAVDTNRVYLTGLSMGGYGTWDLGLSSPERFAAIVPICGGGEFITVLLCPPEKEQALHSLPIWAFHGGKDPVVPVQESERMVDFLKTHGVTDVKLTVYPEAGHDAWTETYNNPELYQWLLRHERRSGK